MDENCLFAKGRFIFDRKGYLTHVCLARIFYIIFPINTINVCIVAILLSYIFCIHIVCYIDVMHFKAEAEFSRFCKRKIFLCNTNVKCPICVLKKA